MTSERRRYIRPEALNLLDYLMVDEQGRQGEYAMARTLNVSKGGVLIETHRRLLKGQQIMITLGLQDQLIDVMGRVVYVVGTAGRFHAGVEFFHLSDADKDVLDRYVSAFHTFYTEEGEEPLE